jgi:hypothetical protein
LRLGNQHDLSLSVDLNTTNIKPFGTSCLQKPSHVRLSKG